jgi:hypothetical protein
MFLLSIVVIGALLSEGSPYLKRQVNIVFYLRSLLIQGYISHILSIVSCIHFFASILFKYLACNLSLRVKNHYIEFPTCLRYIKFTCNMGRLYK